MRQRLKRKCVVDWDAASQGAVSVSGGMCGRERNDYAAATAMHARHALRLANAGLTDMQGSTAADKPHGEGAEPAKRWRQRRHHGTAEL